MVYGTALISVATKALKNRFLTVISPNINHQVIKPLSAVLQLGNISF